MTAMIAPHPTQYGFAMGAGMPLIQQPYAGWIQPQLGQQVPPAVIQHAAHLVATAVQELVPFVIQARLAQVLPQIPLGQQFTQHPQWGQLGMIPQLGMLGQQQIPFAQQIQPQLGTPVGQFL